MPQMHFELKLLIFLYTHLLSIWFSDSVWISWRLQFFLQAIYLLSVSWSSLVSQASQKTISLLFFLCLPFPLLALNVHLAPELHNCTLLIHCTFCLFCHQTCFLWCLDLPAHLGVKPAAQPEGKSVSVLLRQGQTKPICCLNAAEMAFGKMWR